MKFTKIILTLFIVIITICCNNKKENSISKPKKIVSNNENGIVKLNAKEIAEKFKSKNSKIVYEVIKTNIWGLKNVIIAFYESRYKDDNDEYKSERQYVESLILIPKSEGEYQKILVYKFQDDNVDTVISSVFFSNADNDEEKELIILTTCSHRLELLYDGTEYSTYVFDNISEKEIPNELKFLPEISEKLNGGFEGFLEENENSKAKFKNSDDVKKELKRLGF